MPDNTGKRLVELSSGDFCEADVLGIVERIHEYDQNLRVQYLAGRPGLNDAPYRLVESCPDGIDRVVMDIWELDARVLDRIRLADNRRGNILDRLDKNNTRVKENQARRFEEEVLGEAKDITAHVLHSPKSRYSIPGPEDGTKATMSDEPVRLQSVKSGLELRRK